MVGKLRVLVLLLICSSFISTTHSNFRSADIRDPQQCYECTGDLDSDCAKDQKTLKATPKFRTCDPYEDEFETTVPMCGTQVTSKGTRMVKRGCFPGMGEQTCFKNKIGLQCLCRDFKCNSREVHKV